MKYKSGKNVRERFILVQKHTANALDNSVVFKQLPGVHKKINLVHLFTLKSARLEIVDLTECYYGNLSSFSLPFFSFSPVFLFGNDEREQKRGGWHSKRTKTLRLSYGIKAKRSRLNDTLICPTLVSTLAYIQSHLPDFCLIMRTKFYKVGWVNNSQGLLEEIPSNNSSNRNFHVQDYEQINTLNSGSLHP